MCRTNIISYVLSPYLGGEFLWWMLLGGSVWNFIFIPGNSQRISPGCPVKKCTKMIFWTHHKHLSIPRPPKYKNAEQRITTWVQVAREIHYPILVFYLDLTPILMEFPTLMGWVAGWVSSWMLLGWERRKFYITPPHSYIRVGRAALLASLPSFDIWAAWTVFTRGIVRIASNIKNQFINALKYIKHSALRNSFGQSLNQDCLGSE